MMAWGRPLVDQIALIGQQQQSCGILVEAPDRADDGVSCEPPGRQDLEDRGSILGIVAAGVARWLVERHEQPVREFNGLAIHQDLTRKDSFGRIVEDLFAPQNPFPPEPSPGLASTAVAKAGQQLVDPQPLGF